MYPEEGASFWIDGPVVEPQRRRVRSLRPPEYEYMSIHVGERNEFL